MWYTLFFVCVLLRTHFEFAINISIRIIFNIQLVYKTFNKPNKHKNWCVRACVREHACVCVWRERHKFQQYFLNHQWKTQNTNISFFLFYFWFEDDSSLLSKHLLYSLFTPSSCLRPNKNSKVLPNALHNHPELLQ